MTHVGASDHDEGVTDTRTTDTSDSVATLDALMEEVAVLIDYDVDAPHPAPHIEHRDDMPAAAALWECYDLWASGAWDDRNAVYNLEEVEAHLDRFRAESSKRHG